MDVREYKEKTHMRTLTQNHVVHLNAYLAKQKLPFCIHWKSETNALVKFSSCQAYEKWSSGPFLSDSTSNGEEELLQETVTEYLKQQGFVTTFSEDGTSFSVAEKQIEGVAAIIREEDKIFATQRGYGEFKDGWEFPGGKMEPGETPQQALIREIREELDTEIEVGKLVDTVEYDYPNFHLTMHCYLCTIKSGKLILKEHEAAKWLTKENLDSVDWLPADEGLIGKLKSNL